MYANIFSNDFNYTSTRVLSNIVYYYLDGMKR